jgi:hypothetical protein
MSAELSLRDLDALELGELLEFCRDFLTAEADTIGPALDRFAHGYPLAELRADLARFAFLLGGDPTAFIDRHQP